MSEKPDLFRPALFRINHLTICSDRGQGPGAPIVDDVSLSVERGSTLGIAGESGCGKSTLLLAMMGVVKAGLRHQAGTCSFDGTDLLACGEVAASRLRGGRIALIPQNAGLALTPNIRIGDQIAEVLQLHSDLPASAHRGEVETLLRQVRLPMPGTLGRRFPHELSGGQLQRVGIAMALASKPDLLLLDEPTTGLDVTTQLGILDLLADLRRDQGMAMICVSHDLGVIATLCDRVAIMYAGRLIETGPTATILHRPAHPYSRALLASIPRISTARIPSSIPGRPPAPDEPLPGCRFAPRCAHVAADCQAGIPELAPVNDDQWVACRHPQGAVATLGLDAADQRPALSAQERPLIDIAGLAVTYRRHRLLDRLLRRPAARKAVDALTLSLHRGEVLGLVGESGSGKSTILRAISGLWPVLAGEISFDGAIDLTRPVTQRDRQVLQRIQLIFQNPDASLNPRQTIRDILAQPLQLYFNLSRPAINDRARDLLIDVRLDASYLDRLPGDLSGGERQRVAIARAFAANPEVILCDEITSALDVSVQASILQLIADLAVKRNVACLFVSHDLAVVQALAHRIAVLYRGRLMEIGPSRDICTSPRHPYTRALLSAVLEPDARPGHPVIKVMRDEDDIQSAGCVYAGRCLSRVEKCATIAPPWIGAADGPAASCHLLAD
jgi:peptide/nickel transport system ATP-binding protein